jgi:signal peptidase
MMVGSHSLKKSGKRTGAMTDVEDASVVDLVRVESLLAENAESTDETLSATPADLATKSHRVLRGMARWIYRVAVTAVLALIVGAIAVLIVIPRATHGVALTVLTGSMTPDIPVGSVVLDRPVDTRTLKVGDIATYQKGSGADAEYITHRIVKINTSGSQTTFTFKGDANNTPDLDPVPATAIRGEVWFHVPYLGSIRDFIGSMLGRLLVIGVVVVLLGGYSIRQVADGMRESKNKRAADAPGELTLDFCRDAFGSVDPSFVAKLLQGELEPGAAGGFRLSFSCNEQRREYLAELLAPYARTSAETPTDPEPAASQPSESEPVAVSPSLAVGAAAEAPGKRRKAVHA